MIHVSAGSRTNCIPYEKLVVLYFDKSGAWHVLVRTLLTVQLKSVCYEHVAFFDYPDERSRVRPCFFRFGATVASYCT